MQMRIINENEGRGCGDTVAPGHDVPDASRSHETEQLEPSGGVSALDSGCLSYVLWVLNYSRNLFYTRLLKWFVG